MKPLQLFPLPALLLSAAPALCQTIPARAWQETYGNALTSETAQSVIQNASGGLAFVGEWNPSRKTGKDIYFVTISPAGATEISNTNLGRYKDDGAYAVIQTFDGGYAIAGYTESSEAPGYKGGRDAWLVKTDEHGKPLWDKVLGSREDDEFFDIQQDEDGNLVLAGHKGGKVWFYQADWLGNEMRDFTFNGKGKETARSICPSAAGGWNITGYLDGDEKTCQLILLSLDRQGKQLFRKEFKASKGRAVILDSDKNILVAGSAYEWKNREEVLLMKLGPDGTVIWSKTLGGLGNDGANSLLQDFEGNILVTGYSTSHVRGARRNTLWLQKFDSAGNPAWNEPQYIGSRSEDVGMDILQLDDGSILLAGYTAGESLVKDAWLYKLKSEGKTLPAKAAQFKTGSVRLVEGDRSGKLDAKERGYVVFDVTNPGKQDAFQVTATLNPKNIPPAGLYYPRKTLVGHVKAGETRRVAIPVSGSENLQDGAAQFEALLSDAAGSGMPAVRFTVETAREAAPELVIASHRFLSDGQVARDALRGQALTLEVEIKNQGNKTAERIRVMFSSEEHIVRLSDKLLMQEELKPGASVRLAFSFKAEEVFRGDQILVGCRLMDKSSGYGTEKQFSISLKETVVNVEPTANPRFTTLSWVYPDISEQAARLFVSQDSTYDVKLLAISTSPLTEAGFTLLVNGTEPAKGSKFSRVKLSAALDNNDKGIMQYTYTLRATIPLKHAGLYSIQAKVRNEAGEAAAPELKVSYQPAKPNLHILAIGVHQIDLQFCPQDAQEFAKAFARQEGTLFGNVFTTVLSTKETTEVKKLKFALRDLERYAEEGRILPKDVLILFVSSHGFTGKDLVSGERYFRLNASDYDVLYPKETSIEYNEDIGAVMGNIPCKKYLFIDACQKEQTRDFGAKGFTPPQDVNDAIIRLIESQSVMKSLLSCSYGQSSYENPAWGHGAFTKALLEAFENQEVKTDDGKTTANLNGDQILTLEELYQFLQRRVPYMVKTVMKEEQTPYMPESHRSGDLPLYFYDKR